MEIGKGNYVFNRAWSWLSKIITIFNFLMLIYLVIKENSIVLLALPFALIGWVLLTIIDFKYILPTELVYGRLKDPEWVRFSQKVEKQLAEIQERIK